MKYIGIITLASAAILTLSGCSSKSEITYSSKDRTLAKINVFNHPAKYGTSSNAERATISAAMQIAAEQTLSTGNKYFAIIYPDQVSNTKGSKMNTMKEFVTECYPSKISLALGKCGVAYGGGGAMVIRMSKEPSEKYAMYDANEVVDELKKQELYDADKQNVTVKTIELK